MIDHENLLKIMNTQFKVYMSTLKLAMDFIKVGLSITVDRPRETAKELLDTVKDLILMSETVGKESLIGVVKEVYDEMVKK